MRLKPSSLPPLRIQIKSQSSPPVSSGDHQISNSHVLAMNQAPSKTAGTARHAQPKAERSPLKDLNGGVFKTRSSSTSRCSTSIEAPRGCLRFLISNSSSSSSNSAKTPRRLPESNSRNPKIPSSNKPRLKSCKPLGQRRKIGDGGTGSVAEEVQKKERKVTRLGGWQPGKKFSSGSALNPKKEIISAGGHASFGSQSRSGGMEQQGERKKRVQVTVCEGQNNNDFQFTPVGCKIGSGCDLECRFDKALGSNCDKNGNGNTPPVEVTVSPEIQCGSTTVMSVSTPVCFGAGHVLSGVSDKRKCRPRGVLVVGDNCSGMDGLSISDEDLDEIGYDKSGRTVVPSFPAEASMHWLLSPCEEEVDQNGESDLRTSVRLQSPLPHSSGYGTSSNVPKDKNAYIISAASACTRAGIGSSSLVSPSRSLLFQCLLESPSDHHMAHCSSQSPPCATPHDEGVSQLHFNLTGQTSPSSMDTLGSENLIQTPESNSSTERHKSLPWFDMDDEKHAVESNLTCVADGQQRTRFSSERQILASEQIDSSFEFNYLLKPPSSIEFSQLQHDWDKLSWISDTIVENEPRSQLRISWRDGLSSHIFEMDDSDCCRCISDEEDRNNQDSSDPASPEPKLPEINTESFMKFFEVRSAGYMNKYENSLLQKEVPCAESISLDGGSLAASGDFGWDICYKNDLFRNEQ